MSNNNLNVVKSIGAGIRKTEEAVASITANLPEGFDPSARGAVADLVHGWAVGTGERPAVKTGPAGNQKATDYGRGVDALTKAVKRALTVKDPNAAPVMRVSLSGEGGGSTVIPSDSPLYAVLAAMVAGDEVAQVKATKTMLKGFAKTTTYAAATKAA